MINYDFMYRFYLKQMVFYHFDQFRAMGDSLLIDQVSQRQSAPGSIDNRQNQAELRRW